MLPKQNSGSSQDPSSPGGSHSHSDPRLDQFEKRQRELWRLTFVVLFIVTLGFAWFAWDSLRLDRFHLQPAPIGLVVLVVLLGLYVWKKTQELAELKGVVRGMDQQHSAPPTDRQLENLFEMISKSQQGFRELIDSFDDVLLALSMEGEIRAANRSFVDLVGLPFQEVIGRKLSEFFEDAAGTSLEIFKKGQARFLERRVWNGVVQVRLKKTGAVFYFDCVAHAMLRDNQITGLTVLARDISSARRNEARFTELFETLQEGIYIATTEDVILEVNPALIRMLGYDSKEEILSKRVAEFVVDETQRTALIRQVNRQPSPEGREITLRRKDGQLLYCLNTATAVRDTSGKIIRYQGALVDITERRAIEKRLHKQQEFAHRLVESFPDLIFVVDIDRHYTFVSPKVKDALGYEPSEVLQSTFSDWIHPEDRQTLMAAFGDVIAGRRSFSSIEVQVRHKEGNWRRLRCHFSPLFDEQGKIEGAVISARDVTEVKRLEEQLIQAEKLAAMGQMLAGVAHELNNPLTAILGVSELLRDRQGVDENTKRQLEMTHRQARRAARIVQNLLEFSRPASPQKKTLDLNSIVDRTLQLHEHSLKRNNIEVEFKPLPGLPAIVGDANQLIQVILNLVSNAEQAIREVRPSGRIEVRLGKLGERVFVNVKDDGVGIRPEALPKLFDPFFTTKRPGGGTGLGLSICMSIVREHGGDIEAESAPGGGAVFSITLPIATKQAGQRAVRELDSSSGEMSLPSLESVRNRKILVLDDEESIRMLLAEGLGAYNLKVDVAASAEQALQLVLGGKYDVLLCDLKLSGSGPNSDGYGVAQRLRIASGPNRPEVIFMSGDVGGLDEENEGLASARRLQKPFRISDVLRMLMDIFSLSPVGSIRS
jgi:PAS domain S-box-containing protein